ncbi:hypothetical protein QFZ58_003056 [Streptomyces sp. B1I3]|nr:hypothetical protein [Streptomyces sp. B1I3]
MTVTRRSIYRMMISMCLWQIDTPCALGTYWTLPTR